MKNDLKISVIIPAYNAEKYLTATLDSVVSQTCLTLIMRLLSLMMVLSDTQQTFWKNIKIYISNITVINKEEWRSLFCPQYRACYCKWQIYLLF